MTPRARRYAVLCAGGDCVCKIFLWRASWSVSVWLCFICAVVCRVCGPNRGECARRVAHVAVSPPSSGLLVPHRAFPPNLRAHPSKASRRQSDLTWKIVATKTRCASPKNSSAFSPRQSLPAHICAVCARRINAIMPLHAREEDPRLVEERSGHRDADDEGRLDGDVCAPPHATAPSRR